MDDKKSKKRDSRVVSEELRVIEQRCDQAIASAQGIQAKASTKAKIAATEAVGKIAREYTEPTVAAGGAE